MARYQVKSPDGQLHIIEGPDGATPDQVIAAAQRMLPKQAPPIAGGVDPTEGNSFLDNATIATGKGVTSIGRALGLGGVADSLGLPGTKEEADRLDAPLMKTAGGKVGNFVGQAATVAPVVLIPGANTYLGAALVGGATGAATTEGGLADRARGAGFGAAGGAAGKAVGEGLAYGANALRSFLGGRQAAKQVANAGRDAAAASAQQAGYVIPPTDVNPTMLNSALEGLSGKIKTSQSASQKNQRVTNSLAKESLGLPADQPISVDALKNLRQQAGQAYDAVSSAGTITPTAAYSKALDDIVQPYVQAAKAFPNAKQNPILSEIDALRSPQFDAASAVAKIKTLRADADAAYGSGNKELGKSLKAGAKALEDAIDEHLVSTGATADVLQNFRDARQLIAKTYTVEKGLNPVTGDVSAPALASQLKRGKPLSGDLKTIAEASTAFPKATQALQQNYNALSPLDYATGIIGGASGNPLMAAGLALRPAVRSLVLSKPFQRMNAPSYDTNALIKLLSAGANSNTLRRLTPIAGMELLPASQQ